MRFLRARIGKTVRGAELILRRICREVADGIPADTDVAASAALVPILGAFTRRDLVDGCAIARIPPRVQESFDLVRLPAVEGPEARQVLVKPVVRRESSVV